MKRRIIVCMATVLAICSVIICACAAQIEYTDRVEPKAGYSQTTYSAQLLNRGTETIKRGIQWSYINNSANTMSKVVAGQWLENNSIGYSSGMSGAKSAVEKTVGYDVDFIGYKNWSYTVTMKPHKGVSLGLNSVYYDDDLKITKKYQVWSGNSTTPTTTYTYGTAWAKGFSHHDIYVLYDDIK